MFSTFVRLRSTPAVPPATLPRTPYRINSIDLLRGLVMIIMALDHVRDLTHREALTGNPMDFNTTTTLLFFTRWITHFCAPVFVFLAGTSGYLQSLRKPKKELSAFLLKRGVWLVFVELTLMTFAITFDIHWSLFILQVIWAIGIGFIVLGLAVWLPFNGILALGMLIVLGHNSLDFYEAGHAGGFSLFYSLLHRQGFFSLWGNHGVLLLYPLLPWVGLLLLGYCFGRLFTRYEGARQTRMLLVLGAALVLFFIALRATNAYGDPSPWAAQKSAWFTVLSFLNTTKYPPSLLFMCMTIGPALLFLAATQHVSNGLTKVITVYGRVPFFYYVLHFYLIHLVAMVLSLLHGHTFAEGAAGAPNVPFKFIFPGEGVSLAGVYAIWIAVVAALYPLCQWFSRYKQTHKQWWLSYL